MIIFGVKLKQIGGKCMKYKVLIVEDESSIRSLLKVSLKSDDCEIIEAATGEEGMKKAKIEKPNVAILDIMLPGMDGLYVCESLRKEFPLMGIIMLTAKGQDVDKISGLKLGADDYVIKPFNPTELALRVRALIRRVDMNKVNGKALIESHPYKIDLVGRVIYKKDKAIDMTPTEYAILKLFIENKGKAFTRDELLDLVWGINFVGDMKVVDVNIRRLRKKIEEDPSKPMFIETVWGVGYRWKNENE